MKRKNVRAIARTTAIIIVVALIVVAGVAAYYMTRPPPGPTEIVIGGIGPLSPPGAFESGVFLKNGMQMAVDDANAAGGVLGAQLRLVFEDTAGTPDKGVSAAQKLILQDKVVAITGEYHSSVCRAVKGITEQQHIPFLVSECWSDTITVDQPKYTFRLAPWNSYWAVLFEGFIKARGFKNIVIFEEDTDFAVNFNEILVGDLTPLGIATTTYKIDRTAVDFTSQLLDARSKKPDLLINIVTGPAEKLVIKQAYVVGLEPGVFILDGDGDPALPDFWQVLGDQGIGVAFPSMYNQKMKLTSIGESVRDRYKQKFNVDANYVALEGYDSILVLAQAIKNTGSTNADSIVQALGSISVEGTRATITFTNGSGPVWHQWAKIPALIVQHTKVGGTEVEATILYPPELAG